MTLYALAFIGILALMPVLVVLYDEWRHPEPPSASGYWTTTYR